MVQCTGRAAELRGLVSPIVTRNDERDVVLLLKA